MKMMCVVSFHFPSYSLATQPSLRWIMYEDVWIRFAVRGYRRLLLTSTGLCGVVYVYVYTYLYAVWIYIWLYIVTSFVLWGGSDRPKWLAIARSMRTPALASALLSVWPTNCWGKAMRKWRWGALGMWCCLGCCRDVAECFGFSGWLPTLLSSCKLLSTNSDCQATCYLIEGSIVTLQANKREDSLNLRVWNVKLYKVAPIFYRLFNKFKAEWYKRCYI